MKILPQPVLVLLISVFSASSTARAEGKTLDLSGSLPALSLKTITHTETTHQIDLAPIINRRNRQSINPKYLHLKLQAVSGSEMVKAISVATNGRLTVETSQLGRANYTLTVSGNPRFGYSGSIETRLEILSEFLMDFTRTRPNRPGGSVQNFHIPYPTDTLVHVAPRVRGVNAEGQQVEVSPGHLVRDKTAIVPHNAGHPLPDFDKPVKYFGYKETDQRFYYNFNPVIPMLVVGDGRDNRGCGVIVLHHSQIQAAPENRYRFEGYGNIRTRSDAPETYHLGVVLGSYNADTAKTQYLDRVVARDRFQIGYSTTGQLFSKQVKLLAKDHLVMAITGEAGRGRDRNRTTRFEYIKVSPVSRLKP